MTYQTIKTEISEQILTITLQREDKLNALNILLLQEIKQAIVEAQENPEVRGILLTGSGTKAFAAGADIAEFANFSTPEATKMSRDGHEVLFAIERSKKPVIAAVNGFALGGGCELALSCHIRIASENAKFGQPEVNLGVPPGYGGTQRLAQIIGKGRAMDMLLSTDVIDAKTALSFGLVSEVVPIEELIAATRKKLGKIIQKSPNAIARVIDCVNAFYQDGENGFEKEILEFGLAFSSEDFKEGTNAFLEKRKAEFSGN
jgi:enoyl-CoA hydratase